MTYILIKAAVIDLAKFVLYQSS